MNAAQKDRFRVRFPGDLTISNCGPLKASLLSLLSRKGDLHLDFSQVEEMDSAGLQVILAFEREAVSRGVNIEYTLSDRAKRIAEIYGLSWT